MLIVLTTVESQADANVLAEKLVAGQFAACVQILPAMMSVYIWEGEVRKESEHLLLIKTTREKWVEVRDFISANHSYDVPEIIAIDAEKVAGPYLEWIRRSLQS